MGKNLGWRKGINLALALVVVMTLGVTLFPQPVQAAPDPGWYDTSWTYRKQITFTSDTNKIPSSQSYFPVLINLGSDSELAAHAQNNGDDILFTSLDGTTQLDHEIEKFDGDTGELVAWVEVPSLSTGTVVYMYYGNATCSNQEDVEHTWDGGTDTSPANNFKLVQHLDETSGTHYDSTSNDNDGSPNGGVTQGAIGPINGADSFDGVDDAVISPDSASLDITSAVTIEAWVYSTDFLNQYPGIVAKWDWSETNPQRSYSLYLMDWTKPCVMASSDGTYQDQLVSATQLATDTWYYLTGVFTGSKYIIYINGAWNGELSVTKTIHSGTAKLSIGSSMQDGSISTDETFKGTIDEARVSNTVRSADWIKICYENQNEPSTFYGVGHEEQKTTPSSQRWYLSGTAGSYVMYKGDHTQTAGTVTVADDSSEIWMSDEAAETAVGFPANTWTGHITFDAGSLDTTVRVYVGKWDGSTFTPSSDGEYDDVSGSGDFSISASAFDVPTGERLAFEMEDYADGDSNSAIVSVGSNYSYVTSPSSDPGYPIPELPTIILIGVGLAGLGGYIAFIMRKRKRSLLNISK